MSSFLRLNVSGFSFVLNKQTILSNSEPSLLRRLASCSHDDCCQIADGYFEKSDEYYFERSPFLFDSILNFYLTGELHKPKDVCWGKFSAELAFWHINPNLLAQCCQEEGFNSEEEQQRKDGKQLEPTHLNLKQRLWYFFEGDGSLASNGFQVLSLGFICVSVVGLVLSTVGDFRMAVLIEGKNGTESKVETRPHPMFDLIEYICITFFTLEYIVRLFLAPRKIVFLKEALNVIDLTVVLSFYIELMLQALLDSKAMSALKVTRVLRVLRVLRVARVLRLVRYSRFSQKFGLAMRSVCKRLLASLVLVLIMMVFFSTIVYYLEEGSEDSQMTSIPIAFWWSIVTISTVGYGDVVPVTILGKLVGTVTIVAGVLVLALPITIIVSNFSNTELIKEKTVKTNDNFA